MNSQDEPSIARFFPPAPTARAWTAMVIELVACRSSLA
jgi:hypothetical protein